MTMDYTGKDALIHRINSFHSSSNPLSEVAAQRDVTGSEAEHPTKEPELSCLIRFREPKTLIHKGLPAISIR
jgi:hypothetical protein